ncbi:MAG: ferritin family protein, partial [candidate division Zixibacteria bacterium]|nr:ferritin family protein [candidate division Zixibacteria bacterium]
MSLDSVDKVLDFAIAKEEEAAQFYNDLAVKMGRKGMKEVFEGFAREEMGHMAKLMAVKEGKQLHASGAKVMDLKIGETVSDVQPSGDLSYQQALIIAMKAEKAAFKLYLDLA